LRIQNSKGNKNNKIIIPYRTGGIAVGSWWVVYHFSFFYFSLKGSSISFYTWFALVYKSIYTRVTYGKKIK